MVERGASSRVCTSLRSAAGRRRFRPGSVLLGLALVGGCGEADPGRVDLGPGAGLGDLTVRWRIETLQGEPSTCTRAGAERVEVNAAGQVRSRACEPIGEVTFDMLTPGPYPVSLRLLDGQGEARASFNGTAEVQGFVVTELEHTFRVENTGADRGDLVVRWTVDDEPASSACAVVSGGEVTVSAQPGSIEENVEASAACAAGRVEFEDLRTGSYIMRGILEIFGDDTPSVSQRTVRVERNQEAQLDLDFSVLTDDPATLHSRWTVDGQPPATGCAARNVEDVRVRVQRLSLGTGNFVTVSTSSTACPEGRLDTEGLPTSRGIFRVIYDLLDTSLLEDVVVSSTVADDVRLRPAETTTVTVDFPFVD
jgi:hypothetical protein